MPATGKTTNLELPLYNGNDTISELISFNEAMEKIDAFAGTTSSGVEKNTTDIAGLVAEDTTIKGSVAQLTQRVQVIENKIPQYDDDTTDVAQLKTDVAANTAAVQGLDTRTTNLETNVNNLQNEQTSMDGRLETAEDQITDLMSATEGLPAVKENVTQLQQKITAQQFTQITPTNIQIFETSSQSLPSSALSIDGKIVYNDNACMGGFLEFAVSGLSSIYISSSRDIRVSFTGGTPYGPGSRTCHGVLIATRSGSTGSISIPLSGTISNGVNLSLSPITGNEVNYSSGLSGTLALILYPRNY